VPPLRARREDIPFCLILYRSLRKHVGKGIRHISKKTRLERMPGREHSRLQNVVERSLIVSEGESFRSMSVGSRASRSRPNQQPASFEIGADQEKE